MFFFNIFYLPVLLTKQTKKNFKFFKSDLLMKIDKKNKIIGLAIFFIISNNN